jgi:glycosylphosphatidylinositol transamidase (GPIT) subunit GPI8
MSMPCEINKAAVFQIIYSGECQNARNLFPGAIVTVPRSNKERAGEHYLGSTIGPWG